MYGVNEALDMYMCSDDDLAPNKTKPDGQNRMNTCERTLETLCLNLNDSTDKTKKNLKPASKRIPTQYKQAQICAEGCEGGSP